MIYFKDSFGLLSGNVLSVMDLVKLVKYLMKKFLL